ncbi:secreted protein containing DUF1566, partial [Candidatus Magnetobacterium bavaricum]
MFLQNNNRTDMRYPDSGAFKISVLLVLTLIAVIAGVCINGVAYAGTVSLPQTGQTTSYAAYDDGALRKGATWPKPRFTDNGDYTVTDNLTGLLWTKDAGTAATGSCKGGSKAWQEALDYVTCLNGINHLGHSDWRLPNVNELESLANFGKNDRGIWLKSQGFNVVYSDYYWSSTSYASNTSNAWIIGMDSGYMSAPEKSFSIYVWPVRSR